MSLPIYAEYKETGLEWIGKVPAHWEAASLKRHIRLITDRATSKRRAIALENVEGWSGRLIDTEGEFEGDGVAFEPGDVLFGKLRPYLAKVLVPDFPGEAVGDFHVLRPRGTLIPRFIQYQMLQSAFISVVDGSTFGSKMPRASWEALGGMLAIVPPKDEQAAIVSFLDRETAKIDALIAEQEKLLALLAEKRQATISHAVTRGLDPKAPMKESGISWLGEVPAHWTVAMLRRFVAHFEQGWSPECESRSPEEGEWGVLKAGCVNGGVFDAFESKALPASLQPRPDLQVRRGDVLMSRASGSPKLIGSVAYIEDTPMRLMLSDKIFRLGLSDDLDPEFFALLMGSQPLRQQIEQAIGGAEGLANNLPQSSIKNFWICIPPKSEQRAIVEYVNATLASMHLLAESGQRAVNLLRERRSAIIAAAVTGQIDVRGAVEPEAA